MDAISLVVPAYNEAAVIARAVGEAEDALAGRFIDYEILVIDDGSADATAAIVEDLTGPNPPGPPSLRGKGGEKPPPSNRPAGSSADRAGEATGEGVGGGVCRVSAPHTRLIRHGTNRGYGAALRTGFEAARFPLVAFTDADCQFDLAELGTLAALAEEYPIVVGRRVDRKDPWKRRFFSWGYNRLARTLLGTRVRDVDCALKVFRREVFARLLPESRGFFVNTEMMTRARQLGLGVVEVPVTHRPRASGESKVSLKEIPRTAATLLRFWWSNVVFGPRVEPVIPAVYQARVPAMPAVRPPVPTPLPSSAPALPVGPPARRRGVA